jgi:hypothetical protein
LVRRAMQRRIDRQIHERAVPPCEANPTTESKPDAADTEADRLLVGRCLMGEPAAWEELYSQCHGPLCVSIRSLTGPGCDSNVIDEIAARVWYALVKDDGRLLDRFDPRRDVRLGAFFRGLARIEVMRYLRAEHRRSDRELVVHQSRRSDSPLSFWQVGTLLRDFMLTLTPGEQRFLDEHVLSFSQADSGADRTDISDANIWQRHRRIRAKLRAFFHSS